MRLLYTHVLSNLTDINRKCLSVSHDGISSCHELLSLPFTDSELNLTLSILQTFCRTSRTAEHRQACACTKPQHTCCSGCPYTNWTAEGDVSLRVACVGGLLLQQASVFNVLMIIIIIFTTITTRDEALCLRNLCEIPKVFHFCLLDHK